MFNTRLNKVFALDHTKADVRCKVCKFHRYLIVSTDGAKNFWIHTEIKVRNPHIIWYVDRLIHQGKTLPDCISSYKELK